MKENSLITQSLLGLFITMMVLPAEADDQINNNLRQQLHQRDQVILELLDRVEALENQVGVVPAKSRHNKNQDSKTTSQEQDHAARRDAVPGVVVADEAMAERALERSLTRAGALLLSPGVFEFEPLLSYSRQEASTPSFVNTGSGVIASQTESNSDNFTAGMILRYGLPGDAQLEIGLPYRWRHTEVVTTINQSPISAATLSGSGKGDIQLALAKTLLRGESQQPNLIGRLTWDTDSGKQSDNGVSLGGGYQDVQASLMYNQRQDPLVFVTGLSYQYSFEKESIQPGAIVSASFGSYLALNPQTSMSFSFVLSQQRETRIDDSPLPGSDRTIGSFIIGSSSLIARGTLLNLSFGVGLTRDASKLSLTASLPIRF